MTERAGDIPAEPPPYRARLRAAWGPAVALSLALHAALAATARMEQIVSVDLTGPAREVPTARAPSRPAPAMRADPVRIRREHSMPAPKPRPWDRRTPVELDPPRRAPRRRAARVELEPPVRMRPPPADWAHGPPLTGAVAPPDGAFGPPDIAALTGEPKTSGKPPEDTARMAIKEAFPREEEAPGEPPSAGEAEPVETEPPGEEVARAQDPAAVVPPSPAPPEDGPRAGDTAEPDAGTTDPGTPDAGQGGPTRPAEPMHTLRPEYPPSAVRRGHEGRVVIAAHVTAGGRVDQTRVVTSSAHASLDAAARRAVRAARFRPALMDGEPVESWVNVPVRFALR